MTSNRCITWDPFLQRKI